MELKKKFKQELKYILHKYVLPIVYNHYRTKPIEHGKVIFADSNTDTLPESMRLVYEKPRTRSSSTDGYLRTFLKGS